MMKSDRESRIELANRAIRIIGNHGRRFFYNAKNDKFAYFQLGKRNSIWFIDDYTQERIYTHTRWLGRGFSHGGTMNDLVRAFKDFIMTGQPMSAGHYGPWREELCNGDLWGYGKEEMTKVRNLIIDLGIAKKPPNIGYVITHPELGVYLGNCLGLGWWSLLDSVGQTHAATFPTVEECQNHIKSWESNNNVSDYKLVKLKYNDLYHASIDELLEAGLEKLILPMMKEQELKYGY